MGDNKIKQALLVRLSSLGDVIFNMPLALALKNAGYRVTWITSEKGYDIVKSCSAVDEVILAPVERWKKGKFFNNFKEYIQLVKYIRSKHFDIAIDTQLLIKSCIWMIFCGAKRRITSWSAREFAFVGGNEIIPKMPNDYDRHVIYSYLKFAEYLNLDTTNLDVKLKPSSKETVEKIDNLLADLDYSKPIVSIAPATTWVPKHWDKENWKSLIEQMGDKYNLIFTGTKKDLELIDYISGGKGLNIAGKTNVLELLEVFKRTDLLISLDSGSTHLARLCPKPKIVTIFCCTPKGKYAPFGEEGKYIALSGSLSCQPCHKRICPLKQNQNLCTKYPKVQEVLAAVHKLMD